MAMILDDNWTLRQATAIEENLHYKLLENNKVVALYRGDNLGNIFNYYNINPLTSYDLRKDIGVKVFNLGAKSSYYLSNNRAFVGNDIFDNVENISNKIFENLFRKLKKVVVHEDYARKLEGNREFKKLILNFDNVSKVMLLDPFDRKLVRDYYLSFLHQIGVKDYRLSSAVISTTQNRIKADQFGSNFGKIDNFIRFNYFIPEALLNILCIGFGMLENKKCKRILVENEMPLVSTAPYSHQKEYSVRRALFPHFIASIDIITVNSSVKILNPYFSSSRYSESNVIIDGLSVNQDQFLELIRDTAYGRYGEYLNDEYIERQI